MKNPIPHWLYRAEFHLRGYRPGAFPVHIDLELSGKCQLACIMCAYGEGTFDTSKQGMMDPHLANQALIQARYHGAKSVKFNFRGEPGLAAHLHSVVVAAKRVGYVETAINTNLTSFSRRRLRNLGLAGLDLMIVSVDGATKETYEAIRINGDFAKLQLNLDYLMSCDPRPRVRLQMVVQDRNAHEVGRMGEVFNGLYDELVFQGIREGNEGQRKACPQPNQRLVIMHDGRVGACCHNWNHEAVIGHFPEQSLKEIWDSKEARELRELAKHPGRGEPCRTCLVGSSYK